MDIQRRRLLTRAQQAPTRPPWAKTEEAFTSACQRCEACLLACPEQILEKGSGGFPQVSFASGECTFCGDCQRACPHDAFLPLTATPWQLKASIDHQCLADQGIECGLCRDTCPEQAISIKPQIGSVAKPRLDAELCSGCGACVQVCPETAIQIKPASAEQRHSNKSEHTGSAGSSSEHLPVETVRWVQHEQ